MSTKNTLFVSLLMAVCANPFHAIAQSITASQEVYEGIGIDEKLGERIAADVKFANANGDSVSLGEILALGKPVLLNPMYFECPMLCGLVTEGVFKAVDEVVWQPSDEYIIVSYSIDPNETSDIAAKHRRKYLEKLNKKGAEEGWYFLTGTEASIRALSESVGFRYKQIEGTGEYAHLAAILFLSPSGVTTRYLYGISFSEFDVRNALYEAADGKIGTTISKLIMYCYQYDPNSNSYVPVAINIMKIGGVIILLVLGTVLSVLWIREKRKKTISNFHY